jgi:phosphoribosyl-AMP cyclohydrolase
MSESKMIFYPRGDKKQLEENLLLAPKFDQNGLIPVVTTDYSSGEVLMMATMNAESLRLTLELGEGVYWSRSRQEIWHKGKTSGNIQIVRELRIDCDQDALWMRVSVVGDGATCHTGFRSCFYRTIPTGPKAQGRFDLEFKEKDKLFDPAKVYGKNVS